MSLPDDDKDAVDCMVQWLYTKRIVLTVSVSRQSSEECYMQLAKLNTLAEKYHICLLKNDIVDELFDYKKIRDIRPPQLPVIKHVYDNTTERSSFRKLIVAWYIYHIDLEWYDQATSRDELASVSQDFAIDLALASGARHKYPDRKGPFTRPSKEFHESAPNEPLE